MALVFALVALLLLVTGVYLLGNTLHVTLGKDGVSTTRRIYGFLVRNHRDRDELVDLQAAMLDHALGLLSPGGRLVFCTCSLLPDEGEAQVDAALARHPGLRVLPPAADWIEPGWRSSEGGLRLRPDYWPKAGGMDGFYIACLVKA